jgi:hypothetical protein
VHAVMHRPGVAAAAPAAAPRRHPASPIRRPAVAGAGSRIQLQSALPVSSPHDPGEREAEATAKAITRMPEPGPGAAVRLSGARHAVMRRGLTGKSGGPSASEQGVLSEIASQPAGEPLPSQVRGFMESRFGADFGSVRIHTDFAAAQMSRKLRARAFTVGHQVFFGQDQFRPETDEGRELIAHELTHTIQQGAARQSQLGTAPLVTRSVQRQVQRLGLHDALDYFAEHANDLPGFRLFTIVLGFNPINMSRVERSAANILRADVELIPGGALIAQALDQYHVFDRVGAWVDEQLRSLGDIGRSIRQAFDGFVHSLGVTDFASPGRLWDRAVAIFTAPIARIRRFVGGLVDGILHFVKDAMLRPLAEMASHTRGWDLLIAVLGRNPITGDPVPRTAETVVGGFMRLIGEEELWQNIQRAHAIPRVWEWFQGALEGLTGFVRQIPDLFVQALHSLEPIDIVLLPRAFARVARVFGDFAGRFVSWAGTTVWNLLEIVFEVVAPSVLVYLRRAAAAFRTILRDPVAFVRNLVRAGVQGFEQFAAHFVPHLRAALIGWLTGALSGVDVYVPRSFELREIVKFVLSVLGLTWQNIRSRLVRRIGETAVTVLERTFDIVVTLVREGPAAAWERIVEQLSNLRTIVVERITAWVRERIVQAAMTFVATSLNPAGAFIQAILAIYNTVMFFVERMRQLAQVVATFIDSISAIANGEVSGAANRVEQTMEGLLTLVISFLARLVHLGGIGDAVMRVLTAIRAPVDRAIDHVIDWIVNMARRIGGAIGIGGADREADLPEVSFEAGGERHRIWVRNDGGNLTLMMSSHTDQIREFLRSAQSNTEIPDAQKAEIPAALRIATRIDNLLAAAGRAGTPQARLSTRRDSLAAEQELVLVVQRILRSVTIDHFNETYRTEGLVGSFASLRGQARDRMTPDHQPQYAVFRDISQLPIFTNGEASEMVNYVAGGRGNNLMCINLHERRHMQGRTYGSRGSGTRQEAMNDVRDVVAVSTTAGTARARTDARAAVVRILKRELRADVAAMSAVARRTSDETVYGDILANRELRPSEKAALVRRISQQVVQGEQRISDQDLDRLKS